MGFNQWFSRSRVRWVMLPRLAAGVVTITGCAILLGWVHTTELLRTGSRHWGTMKPNEALGLVFGGMALFWLRQSEKERAARYLAILCALGVALIGSLTLAEYCLQIDFGIDQVLINVSHIQGIIWPARMGMNAALALLAVAGAILLSIRRLHSTAQLLVLLALLIALQQLIIYLYGSESLYFGTKSIDMSLYSAAAFIVLSLGILLAYPAEGVIKPITCTAAGAMMARRLLPTIIAVPLVVGWLRTYGEKEHYFGPDSGTASVAVASIAILAAVVWFNALWLNKAEAERKTAEEQAARLAAIVEHSHEAIVGKDLNGIISSWNAGAEQLFGYTAGEVIGGSMPPLCPPDRLDEAAALAAKALTGESVEPFESVRVRKSGQHIHVLLTVSPIKDNTGKLIGTSTIARDITMRKQGQEAKRALHVELEKRAAALEAVNKELEAFSYSVSHDLRAPLRAIDGYTQMVMEEYGEKFDEEGRGRLKTVRRETERMGKLIEDLLAFSRIGRQLINITPVDMTALAREVVEELSTRHQGTKPTFQIEPLPAVPGDVALLRQVFVNLLSNAIKFSSLREQPLITVGALNGADSITYFVKDNGAGFDPRYADKLFGVFQRLHTESEFKGTGVGLALVQRIVVRHKGRVWAESEVNQGATFFFSLPSGTMLS